MTLVQGFNARLAGLRIYLVALVCALPDVLNAVVGFDFASVLPPEYAGYGARIGSTLALARLVLPPVIRGIRDAARPPGSRPEDGPDGEPH